MNKKNPRKAKESPKRVSGVRAPERVASGEPEAGPSSSEGFQEKIARLEEELRDMRLERDLYREIIDVAERRYNVPILKKLASSNRQPACTVSVRIPCRETMQIAWQE